MSDPNKPQSRTIVELANEYLEGRERSERVYNGALKKMVEAFAKFLDSAEWGPPRNSSR